jgi:hypothetical protein
MRAFLFSILCLATVLVTRASWSAEPRLVGHWKLDDTTGDTVVDSSASKSHGKAVAQPGRTQGKIGGAFTFNGKDSYVEIANSTAVDKVQGGSYSIAAWFKPDIAPPGTEDTANDSEFGIVTKTGWHEGLSYNRNKEFIMTHWLAGDVDPVWNGIGTWGDPNEPGKWYHLVGVVDQQERVVKLYVDGVLKATSDPWSDGAKSRDYEQQTWKIGVAGPGNDQYAWFAKGAIDDVRMYQDALTDDQVASLFRSGTSGK